MIVSIYTDGSADNSKGFGSYGFVAVFVNKGKNHIKKHSSGKYVDTTSNRMELKAIIKALEEAKTGFKFDIYSDSRYCIDSITKWLPNWYKNGEIHKKKNSELWERFLIVRKHHLLNKSVLNFAWVRGHNGNEFNEIADGLANKGRLDQTTQGVSCKKSN